MRSRPIIAIDGPAASGKSSTARAVAASLGYVHLDSGAVYRACTLVALDSLGAPQSWTAEKVASTAHAAGVAVRSATGALEVLVGGRNAEPAIRADRVTAEVSRVAAMGPVRDFVNGLLRRSAQNGGVVMDGRDIGTVVFPDADVKIFMVADAEERARRRLAEKGVQQDRRSLEAEAGALVDRDRRDSKREVAPLAMAPDAVMLDTTAMSFPDQVAMVVTLARKAAERYR
ncbi:MAG TPA: (d)CMP kinase [Gemmatimonadales bacterium]